MPRLDRPTERDFERGSGVPLRRVFGVGEDPLSWSFPVLRVAGVSLRLHLIVPLWIAAELAFSIPFTRVGPAYVAAGLAAALAVALLREFVRGMVALACGSERAAIVAWPLGGLMPVAVEARRPFLAEAGGLIAGLVMAPLLAMAVWGTGADLRTLLFNPFSPRETVATLLTPWQVAAWWMFYANAVVLAMNLVLPMHPFDAARLMRAHLRDRVGTVRANDAVTRVGFFAAVGLLVLGAAASETRLIAIAIFSAVATALEFRRAEFLYAQSVAAEDDAEDCPDIAPEPLDQLQEPPILHPAHIDADEPDESARLDSILQKISREGLKCLSENELGVLRRETRRRNEA